MFALVALGGLSPLGCASSRPVAQGGDVAAQIRHANEVVEESFRKKDVETLLRVFYAAEPIAVFGNARQTTNLEGARQAWREMLSRGTVVLETQRIEASCDLAAEIGRWTLLVEPAEGDQRQEKGVYYVTWKRTGRDWKAVTHHFIPGGFEDAQ